APQGKNVTVLSQNPECSPCTVSTMKHCPHRKCLTALEPEYVIRKLAGLVELTLTRGGVGITVNSEIPKQNERESLFTGLNSLLCRQRGIATYIFKRVPGDPL